MAKQDLYEFLEHLENEAINKIDKEFTEKYEAMYERKMGSYHIKEEIARLRSLALEMYNGHIAWAEQNFETINSKTSDKLYYGLNSWGNVLHTLARSGIDLTGSEAQLYKTVSSYIQLPDDLIELKRLRSVSISKTREEYSKLTAVCKATRSVSKLSEYLSGLGFDTDKVNSLLNISSITALSTNINTSLLRIGGDTND